MRQVRGKWKTGRAITRTQGPWLELPALWPLRYNQTAATNSHKPLHIQVIINVPVLPLSHSASDISACVTFCVAGNTLSVPLEHTHVHTLADIGFCVCSRGPGHIVEPSRTLITVDSFSVVLAHTPCIHLHSMGDTCASHSLLTMNFYIAKLYEDNYSIIVLYRLVLYILVTYVLQQTSHSYVGHTYKSSCHIAQV